ncbi:MAG: hypothetical protein RMJ66_04125 [Bacteroidia bacterium]|nr:hypothetical protein [Bacteroidia bacterium]MDW8134234.1 hypothetical protein [Bacteroidia bacterium]
MRWVWVSLMWGQTWAPRLLGTAEAQAPLQGELLSLSPATAFSLQQWAIQAGVTLYAPSPELNFRMIAGSFSWDTLQGVQLRVQQWGFDKITQWEAGAGYALRILEGQITLAVRGRLVSTDFSEYGRRSHLTPDIGFRWRISPKLHLGGYGYNLLAQGWGLMPENIIYALGAAFVPSSHAQLIAEIGQEGLSPLQIRTAFSYSPSSFIVLRAGIGVPLLTVGGGFTIRLRSVGVDFGYRYQPTIGSWGGIGISYPD